MDHLTPNQSPFTGHPILRRYHRLISEMVPRGDQRASKAATIVCLPSAGLEWALRVESDTSGQWIGHARTLLRSAWPPHEVSAVEFTTATASIPADLAVPFVQLVQKALLGIRHTAEDSFDLDDTTFHIDCGHLSGMASGPSADSSVARLCELAQLIYDNTLAEEFSQEPIQILLDELKDAWPAASNPPQEPEAKRKDAGHIDGPHAPTQRHAPGRNAKRP